MANENVSIKNLILVPAVITLAVTLLRLTGELMHWSSRFFNPAPGGIGAVVGIAWLAPLFGIYFALKLAEAGLGSPAGPAIGWSALGLLVMPVLGFAAVKLGGLDPQGFGVFGVFVVLSIVGVVLAYRGGPALWRTLFAYALAARIPVAIVMLVAILGNWGTHYDVVQPNFPPMNPFAKWLLIGVVPQMTVWIWYTITTGMLLGSIVVALTGKDRRLATA